MSRKRLRKSPEEYARDQVEGCRILGDFPERLAHQERLLELQGKIVQISRDIVGPGSHHQLYASRGERWSNTYALRRAEETLAQHEAAVKALREALA